MAPMVRCPRCGLDVNIESESNPVRNVVRETIDCRKCGYTNVKEHAPDVTLGDWLEKK